MLHAHDICKELVSVVGFSVSVILNKPAAFLALEEAGAGIVVTTPASLECLAVTNAGVWVVPLNNLR
jgi:hypothetical protein